MKKPALHPLLFVTLLFAFFTGGLFLGRNYNHSDVQFLSVRADAPEVPAIQDALDEAGNAPLSLVAGETRETAADGETAAAAETQASGLLNINTATAAQLDALPGIGEVIAQRIVDYRNANGPFPSVTALINVKGIGEKKLAAILHLITV